jgi:hypothetical protein
MKGKQDAFGVALRQLAVAARTGGQVIEIEGLLRSLERSKEWRYSRHRQEDVAEVLCNVVKLSPLLGSLLNVEVRQWLKCLQCTEPARGLDEPPGPAVVKVYMPVGKHTGMDLDLQQLLQETPQTRSCLCDCPSCGGMKLHDRADKFCSLPDMVIVQVVRFEVDERTSAIRKLGQPVRVPAKLDIGALVSEDTRSILEAGQLQYSLISFIEHEGLTPSSGHYVTYSPTAQGEWIRYSDEIVERAGALKEMRPYLVFYAKPPVLPVAAVKPAMNAVSAGAENASHQQRPQPPPPPPALRSPLGLRSAAGDHASVNPDTPGQPPKKLRTKKVRVPFPLQRCPSWVHAVRSCSCHPYIGQRTALLKAHLLSRS